MVSDRQLFINLDEGEIGMINTSCGLSTLQIKGKGSIKTKFKDRIIVLHNVLFVPDITVNVISLRHLLLEQCQIDFYINHFTILKNNEPFLDGHYENNLPILKLEPVSSHSTHLSSGEIIHKSLGHVSFCRLRRKLGIPIKASETCKSPLSHKLHKYVLTIVDGYTRFVAAVPLTSKSEVFSTLSQVINIEAKRLGYYPSVLHSDRGTEFLNAQVGEFCRTNVIRQRFSDEYTPQQNGLAERFNRTVIESLRTVMLDSGLKPNLWNEVISSCVLALNQIPTHKSKKSPYELFKNSTIPLEFFKPIGNPVAVLSNLKKSKLEPRGDFGKLIGLNAELKSYRIKLDDGRIINSKNVKFLDFDTKSSVIPDYGELLIEDRLIRQEPISQPVAEGESNDGDEAVAEEDVNVERSNDFQSAEENSLADDDDVAELLVPD
ncbi:hypothetical protein VP01_78g1 [Puccinia sorghi]|uniref:Integrase catalytic domain-containing protein n=1 Tax=Puccinia sorghi TaxID=27349 RepID=A0A0L6UAZ1_9BASI|nr:hypothetical protein VP01_78g1 [Puccinia sorghi]